MRLYRPVGLNELLLIYESEMTAFPPRLQDQPIFYPVLNAPNAVQIAREWNSRSNTFAGYVTQFDVADDYAVRFEPHIVGARQHEELWVPAEQLAEFNRHITGRIAVVEAYFGEQFSGYIAERFNLKGKGAVEQFVMLELLWRHNGQWTLEARQGQTIRQCLCISPSGCNTTFPPSISRTSGASIYCAP